MLYLLIKLNFTYTSFEAMGVKANILVFSPLLTGMDVQVSWGWAHFEEIVQTWLPGLSLQ